LVVSAWKAFSIGSKLTRPPLDDSPCNDCCDTRAVPGM
jgi:hypothetical protein